MPGLFLHMEIAHRAMAALAGNASAASFFASGGPSAQQIQDLATDPANAAYLTLGAIGPDFFFFLPDFKPPFGNGLFPAAQIAMDFYQALDETVLGPYERQLGPILANREAISNSQSGGVDGQKKAILRRALLLAAETGAVAASTQCDVFGLLGSGVPQGCDEQAFFWSDMLHYRKTYEFAAHLWRKAGADQRLQAYALGWMSHVAADVTGHAFVNQKCGGPFRLHWQRHHLVENHMDGFVWELNHGGGETYRMLADAALHRWIAFDGDTGDSIEPQPAFDAVSDSDSPAEIRRKLEARHEIWDVDSEMPDFLARFLAESLREVYTFNPNTDPSTGQCAAHPTIIEDYQPGSHGFPSEGNIKTTYWWVFNYLKRTTTDVDLYEPPELPKPIVEAPFPEAPPAPGSQLQPPTSLAAVGHDSVEIALGLVAWLMYLEQIPEWIEAEVVAPVAGIATYLPRLAVWAGLEVPLYNALLSVHWYLAMIGVFPPLRHELNPGLHTLGVSVDWSGSLRALLDDPLGGLDRHEAPLGAPEPSGLHKDHGYPHDAVTDPPEDVEGLVRQVLNLRCGLGEAPSEFLRPWLFPVEDNAHNLVPTERPQCPGGPFSPGQNPTALLGGFVGDNGARALFENAQNEGETIALGSVLLPQGRHLGDPVDYTIYTVARLTRTNPGPIANFNLDADRGYGYLCWDWLRSASIPATPAAWRDPPARTYQAPLRPGFGWCAEELRFPIPSGTAAADQPLMHDTTVVPNSPGQVPVKIRYVDREGKFR